MTDWGLSLTTTETASGTLIDLEDPKMEDIKIEDIAWALSRQSRYAGHTMCRTPYTVAQHTVMVSRYVEEALTPGSHLNVVFTTWLEKQLQKTINLPEAQTWSEHLTVMEQRIADEHRRSYAFHGLMHDFAEAYLVDLPTPVKRLSGVYEVYKAHELRFDALIYLRFNLGYGPRGIMSLGDIKFPLMWEFSKVVVGWADMYALMLEAYHLMPSRGLSWGIPMDRPSLSQIYAFRWPVPNEQAYEELLVRFEELRPKPVLE